MTDDRDRKKGELIDFMEAAAKRGRTPAESKPSIAIKGNGNIVGNNNQVRVTYQTRPATKVVVTPGAQHITQAQAAEIRDLVNRLFELQGHTHKKVWTILKRHFNFTSYHLLPATQFADVKAYLRSWLAKTPAPKTRNTLLKRIHAQARNHPGGIEAIKATAAQLFGSASLSPLTSQQLAELITECGL